MDRHYRMVDARIARSRVELEHGGLPSHNTNEPKDQGTLFKGASLQLKIKCKKEKENINETLVCLFVFVFTL